MAPDQSASDIFEDILNLEEQYYREGYELGVVDGAKSGRIEGRVFGLEKGFDKFVEMGRLNGRAAVWESRLELPPSGPDSHHDVTTCLPLVTGSERLRKHIDRLSALSDPNDLSTDNSEDAVSEVDDRLKDAKAKATLITRIVGEDQCADDGGHEAQPSETQRQPVRLKRNEDVSGARPIGEMEDFIGLARG